MPGRTLWWHVFNEGEFAVSPWAEGIQEGWLDTPDNYYFPADTVCWQYRFQIPAEEAFEQLGSPNSPVTYWLDLKAIPDAAEATFGWKTSLDHWNDDAVWVVGGEPYSGLWNELRYPEGHQLRGQSMDLAFAVWSEPFPWETDYGDAPDPTHPTLLASDGARHTVDPAVFMGASIDSEPDGQPAPPALGDDVNGIADEDGVSFLSVLGPGAIGRIRVIASADGYLDAWVDFGRDGSWAEPGDLIFRGTVSAGPNLIIFPCPLATVPGLTCSRFRFNTGANIGYTGRASDGEVEDYTVMLTEAGEVPGGGVPKTFHLYQSTPNPFSHSARIRFDLPRPEKVTLTVIGVDGRRVATLMNRLLSEGEHVAVWDGRDDDGSRAAAGVYYYRLQAGAFERTMKLILLP
mgnify:FL=1